MMEKYPLLTAPEQDIQNIEKVVEWLEGHFGETFDMPIYFDKKRLLDTFICEYADPKNAAERMEHLFRKQFKRNMTFALEHIGYEPTFRFYAEVLSRCWFGTFGFSDILNPWIAATQDLESTLHLITESKRLRLERGDKEKAAEYDLNHILKNLLNDFILWTVLQQYAPHERFFIEKAMKVNPAYFQLDTALEDLRNRLNETVNDETEHSDYVAQIRKEPNKDKKTVILRQLKEKRDAVTAGAHFEQWLEEETDENVLLYLRLLLSMKIYDRSQAYARYRILHDRELWAVWRIKKQQDE